MRRIEVLCSAVIDLIAAGEVVDRPAAIVKELVENSLDAGASEIRVEIEGGGIERLVVSDDGGGMGEADAQTCLLRHATSKLRTADDLQTISSLGFRGEALSSIAAVSELQITTRLVGESVGTRVSAVAGRVTECGQVGCPPGTLVEIKNLFFNTPARRKFLRSPATEQAHAVDAAARTLLAARGPALAMIGSGRLLVDFSPAATLEARIGAWWGPRIERVYSHTRASPEAVVSLYFARPDETRGDNKGLWCFVNGRFVRDRMLQRAVIEGYRSLLEHGRYPWMMAFVDVPPDSIDVNVHPQKLEVRFRHSETIFHAVAGCVNAGLALTPWLEDVSVSHARIAPGLHRVWPSAGTRELGAAYVPGAPQADRSQAALAPDSAGGRFSRLTPLGQALGTFLVCCDDDELVLIDQHAAHERVVFEALRRQEHAGSIARQDLLFPDTIELTPALAAQAQKNSVALVSFGFDLAPVGPNRFAIRSVPAALPSVGTRELVLDLLDELGAIERGGAALAAADSRMRVLSRCACHAAVRAGDSLNVAETAALLASLDRVDFGVHCPHGRPVFQALSRQELYRMFHRS